MGATRAQTVSSMRHTKEVDPASSLRQAIVTSPNAEPGDIILEESEVLQDQFHVGPWKNILRLGMS